MEKRICENCGEQFYPDDENDLYCCEVCLDEANGEDEDD